MSWLSDFIDNLSGAGASRRNKNTYQDRLRELKDQTQASSDVLRNLLSGMQGQIGQDVSGYQNKFQNAQDALTRYIQGIPAQEIAQRQGILGNLGLKNFNAINQLMQGNTGLTNDLRTRIQQLNSGALQQTQDLLNNRNQSVLNDLNSYLSGASVLPAQDLQAELASRGISSNGGAYASALASLMQRLGEQKFNVQNQLNQDKYQQIINLLQGQNNQMGNLEQGFTDVGRQGLGTQFNTNTGLAQYGANITREDQNAQRQALMQNYLNNLGYGREDVLNARGIQNQLKYQAPMTLEQFLQNLLLGNKQNQVEQAGNMFNSAKQEQLNFAGGLKNLGLGLAGGLGANYFANKFYKPRLSPLDQYYQRKLMQDFPDQSNPDWFHPGVIR